MDDIFSDWEKKKKRELVFNLTSLRCQLRALKLLREMSVKSILIPMNTMIKGLYFTHTRQVSQTKTSILQ